MLFFSVFTTSISKFASSFLELQLRTLVEVWKKFVRSLCGYLPAWIIGWIYNHITCVLVFHVSLFCCFDVIFFNSESDREREDNFKLLAFFIFVFGLPYSVSSFATSRGTMREREKGFSLMLLVLTVSFICDWSFGMCVQLGCLPF